MAKVTIENIGPVERLDIEVPVGGGIVVFQGRNGRGKTRALEALDNLTAKRGTVQARDGTLKGSVSGFGAQLTVARNIRRSGTLEVESLEGRLSLADLVDPGLKDEGAADAKRIKALVDLGSPEADVMLFARLFETKAEFAKLVTERTIESDDLNTLASRIKRDCEKAARDEKEASVKATTRAKALREMIGDIDVSREVNSEKVFARLQDATTAHATLAAQQKAAAEADEKSEKAAGMLQAAEESYEGPHLEHARGALGAAVLAHDNAEVEVTAANERLSRAVTLREVAANKQEEARLILEQAEQHIRDMAAWREALEAEVPLPPDPAELKKAAEVQVKARAAVARLPELTAAKQRAREAAEAEAEAATHVAQEARLRDAARGTDEILSEAIGRLNSPLRVESGRLVLDTTRGDTYFSDLSMGERWKQALDVAIAVATDRTIFTIPQEAWESLDPQNRAEFAGHVKERGVLVFTAEATGDEELAHEVFEDKPE